MVYLVDTNVLLRLAIRAQLLHPVARGAIRKLKSSGHRVVATPQNFIELWNVATRPAGKNGLGLSPANAHLLLKLVERIVPLLPDTPTVYPEWRKLVVSHGVCGSKAHDARLVAAMISNAIQRILTFNTADFIRYSAIGIQAIDPTTV